MDTMYMHIAAGLIMNWPKGYKNMIACSRKSLENMLSKEVGTHDEDSSILTHYNTRKNLDGFLVFKDRKLSRAYAMTTTSRKGIIDMLQKGRDWREAA